MTTARCFRYGRGGEHSRKAGGSLPYICCQGSSEQQQKNRRLELAEELEPPASLTRHRLHRTAEEAPRSARRRYSSQQLPLVVGQQGTGQQTVTGTCLQMTLGQQRVTVQATCLGTQR